MAIERLVMFVRLAIVGYTGQFLAYIADADIPALLEKEALETLGGHLNFRRCVLTLGALGADIPFEMNTVGHYPLNVAEFPESQNARTFERRASCCAKCVWRLAKAWSGATPSPLWMLPRGPRCARRVGVVPLLPFLSWKRNSWNYVDYALEARF